MSHYLSMKAYKSQYDAILNPGEPAKVRDFWLHLLDLYFPHELGFGLTFQDWHCNGFNNLSIAYLTRCNTDTGDFHYQHKDMFVLTSESPLREMPPETMDRILVKFTEKIRALCTTDLDNQKIHAAVAAGTHVRFFSWLNPKKKYLTDIKSEVLELAEHENQIDEFLDETKDEFMEEWGLY